ncbi:hypothetical protein TraAM80_07844 [Trypanosoma rangeli]|uniref:Uncharacterized protein n=1 Tax=Trypanosoma rangeli TaxID=5698 RepID=A0A422N3F4_TRYRA|nr:uncharacterized protein TraAM80_07844 [Trypanosoma rangeli]RNF00017.1 hypothetical protein TraAM80_07844 [Trypanosoma rangeli]|eukprot:RNF00017.1 hypothetical protein TraAM80_07844 [Trypanosoma rangeli]
MTLSWDTLLHRSSPGRLPTNGLDPVEDGTYMSWKEFLYIAFSIGMVFGPHIGYVFQLHEMTFTRNVEGYSPLVSLILLVSNSIRIVYFFGHHFALALLFQAVFAILVHTALLIIVLHMTHSVSRNPEGQDPRTEGLEDEPAEIILSPAADVAVGPLENREGPIRWGEVVTTAVSPRSILARMDAQACRLEQAFLTYFPVTFIRQYALWTAVVIIVAIVYYGTIGTVWAAAPEVIGYLALGIEALLVLPQILRNDRRKSTQGLTIALVLTWFVGDIIKVFYFIFDHQPFPFILCGCFQLSLDLVVVGQIIYFRVLHKQLHVGEVSPTHLPQVEVADSPHVPRNVGSTYEVTKNSVRA